MADFAPPPPPPPARPRHVLLVEDHAPSADALARLLRGHGHLVQVVGTLARARTLCGEVTFDVVLCDVLLPDGSGLDLIPCVRDDRPRPRFVAVTSSASPDEIRLVQRHGVDAIVFKPCQLVDVLAVLGP